MIDHRIENLRMKIEQKAYIENSPLKTQKWIFSKLIFIKTHNTMNLFDKLFSNLWKWIKTLGKNLRWENAFAVCSGNIVHQLMSQVNSIWLFWKNNDYINFVLSYYY